MPLNYLDSKKVHKSLECLLQHYPNRAFIAGEIHRRLLEHLPVGHTATDALNLLQEYRWLTSNNKQLDYPDETFDLIVANLVPLWAKEMDELLAEIFRLLKPGGIFLVSTLGVSSFSELRESFKLADDSKQHIHQFYDMHDIGDFLIQSGFLSPVMSMEQLSFVYLNMGDLITDITQSGLRNSLVNRKKGLMTPRQWKSMADYYQAKFAVNNELPLSLEAIYGYAQKPKQALKAKQMNAQGEIEIAIEDIFRNPLHN